MKKFILSLISFCFAITMFGQYYFPNYVSLFTVYTPNNTAVEAIDSYPLSYVDSAYWVGYMNNYPNITILSPPTANYNCHGYAWYFPDTGLKVWIDSVDTNLNDNLANFWLDGSYIEVSNSSDADVILYEGDHSAVPYYSTKLKSKWGPAGVAGHEPDNVPVAYLEPDVYFAKPKVSGNELLCYSSNGTFTVPSYVNCTYNWNYDTQKLEYVSGQNTDTFVVTPKNSGISGSSYVTVAISIGSPISETVYETLDFWVGVPEAAYDHIIEYYGVNEDEFCPYDIFGICVEHDNPSYAVTRYDWDNNNSPGQSTSPCKNFSAGSAGYKTLTVEIVNTCGSSDEYIYEYTSTSEACEPGEEEWEMLVYPNPADTEVRIEFLVTDESGNKIPLNTSLGKENTVIQIRIRDQFSKVLNTTISNGSLTLINIESLLPGIYYVEASTNKYSVTRQLIVNKKEPL